MKQTNQKKLTRKEKLAKEQYIKAIDDAIVKLYDDYSTTIEDPRLLCIMVAKTYAHAMLLSYKKAMDDKEQVVVKPSTKQNQLN